MLDRLNKLRNRVPLEEIFYFYEDWDNKITDPEHPLDSDLNQLWSYIYLHTNTFSLAKLGNSQLWKGFLDTLETMRLNMHTSNRKSGVEGDKNQMYLMGKSFARASLSVVYALEIRRQHKLYPNKPLYLGAILETVRESIPDSPTISSWFSLAAPKNRGRHANVGMEEASNLSLASQDEL